MRWRSPRLLYELLRAAVRSGWARLRHREPPGMPWRTALFVELLRRDLAPVPGNPPVVARRAEQPTPLPPGLARRLDLGDGRLAGLRCFEARPETWRDDDLTVLYFHGGGYCLCSAFTSHRAHIAQLAMHWQARVLAPEYRLAPEHPWPAALDDASAAWRALVSGNPTRGPLVVAGDSAGGGLSVALLARLAEAGEPLPGAAVLFSPWVDLTLTSPSIDTHEASDYLSRELLEWFARHALAGQDPRRSGASPLFGPLGGLPPILIQVGGVETLSGDARQLARGIEAAGGEVRLEVAAGMPHVYQVLAPLVPQAVRALESAGRWLDEQLSGKSFTVEAP